MPLPILKTPQTDLIRLFHRMILHSSQHYGDAATLDVGQAIGNPQLDEVDDANIVLDAALPEGLSPAEAVGMVEQHFAAIGCRCRAWVPNPAAPPVTTQPLIDHLLAHGGRAVSSDIWYLSQHHLADHRDLPGVTVIPARASFKHARQIAEIAVQEKNQLPQMVEALLMHLDDPHWDALLALRDGQAIAAAGVLAVGEAGMIDDVYVAPIARRQGVGLLMMQRLLATCARALFRHVMLSCAADNTPAQSLYTRLGFRKIGAINAIRFAARASSP